MQVTDWGSQEIHYNYDAAGRLAGTALPNGVSSWYAYDAAGRLVGLTHLRPEGPGWSFQYGYDAAGSRVTITETTSAQWSFAAPEASPNASLPETHPTPSLPALDGDPSGLAQTLETIVDGLTVHYTYDPLRRLVGAVYSSGESFGYEYDWAGNVLTYTQNLAWQEVVTTYTYQGDQLATAKASNSPTTWHYAFDVEGRLVEVTPGGSPGNGARRYSYSAAGYLVEVESHDGTAYLPQAEMVYNGLGQRLLMTAYAGGLSLTTQYALDSEGGAAPLAATANSESTYYLYGLGAAAERAAGWSYYLHDGLGSLRKVVDADAGVTLERSYTPWGDVLTQSGSINPAQGYLGGWVDAATGLIYVGNGQYYDPHTGRFLTRDAQPGRLNPYAPRTDPTGLLVGPLALLVLARGKKGKKGSGKVDLLLLVMVVLVAGSLTLAACGGGTQPPPTEPTTPTQPDDETPTPTGTQGTPTATGTEGPLKTPFPPAATCQEAPVGTPTLDATEEWNGIINVLWNEGASSFDNKTQRDNTFELELWALRSQRKYDTSLQNLSYTEIVQTERYSAREHFTDAPVWPTEYRDHAQKILGDQIAPPPEFDREAIYFISATHFLRRAPEELNGGTPYEKIRSNLIPGCNTIWCAFPDIRWRTELKRNSIDSQERFINLEPKTYQLYYVEHYQNQYKECYWIGLYFNNWKTHEAIFNKGNSDYYSAPSYAPDSNKASELACPAG